MASFSKITLLGRVGKAPQLSEPKQGLTIARFTLAVTEKVNGQEETQWYNISVFNKPADFVSKYVHKGDQVLVEGKPRTNKYKKDNVDVERLDVQATEVRLVQSVQPKNEADDLPSDF